MEDWIGRIKENTEGEISRLYVAYKEEAVSWLRSTYGVSDVDARDAFQYAMAAVYHNVDTQKLTEARSSAKTYIFSICKNYILKQKSKPQMASVEVREWHASTQDVADIREEIHQDRWKACLAALDQLGDPCKSLLSAFYLKRKKIPQLQEELGYKNANTVKTQKYKCLKRLQKLMLGTKV